MALSAGCREAPSPWSPEQAARMPLRQKVGQMVAPALYVGPDARPAADTALARRFAAAHVGGVRLLPGSAPVAARRIAAVQRASRLPLLVIGDLDRGTGGALAGATEFPPPLALSPAGADSVQAVATSAAAEARALGINFALLTAPGFPYPTAIPAPSGAATEQAFAGYAEALAGAGMLVGVRALSRGPAETGVPILGWDRAAVEGMQLGPLRDLLARGVTAVKPASIVLPSLTRDTVPLPENPVFVQGILRRDMGFGGLVIEDLAPVTPLVRRYGPHEAAVRAVAAGADLLVGVDDLPGTVDALVRAVESGRIPLARVDEAVQRVFAAKEKLGLAPGRPAEGAKATSAADRAKAERERAAEADARAVAAHRAAATVLGRAPAELLRGCRATVLLTFPGVDARPLSAGLLAGIPGLTHLQVRRLPRRGPLVAPSVEFAGRDAECVVAAAFPGARPEVTERVVPPLAWPDSAARDTLPATVLAPLARDTLPRRIVWIDFFPPADAAPPAVASVVLARGTGSAAQRAVAALVLDGGAKPAIPAGAAWPAARTLRVLPADSAGMNAARLASIDSILRNAIRDSVFSAAAVAIGRRGMIVKMQGYGQTGGAAVDPRSTLFDIASLSKVVGTTAAAMVMVDEGRMELGAPVRRYVSGYRGGGKGDVTVRHLLTHTAGLPAGSWLYGSASSPEQAVRQVIRARLVSDPGQTVRYSDFGMILLAEAIQRRAEEPLDRFVARRVFGPLGMQSTMYLPPTHLQPRTVPTSPKSEHPFVVDGVVHDGNAYRLGGVTGHAGLFSTAWDLSVYSQTLLNGGAYGTRRVFGAGTVGRWTARQPGAETRALGWDTPAARSSAGDYLSARSFGHTGFTGTSMWIDPERELFVILLTNRTYRSGGQGEILRVRARVADAAALSITDATIRPRAGTATAIEQARPKPKPKPQRPRRPPPRRRR
ncbi:MAG TPA: serine hydrolase [Longimicrobium sp.]|uniref:serine hydrolase n=1 Tax=Longimicrobium sp. TaxID=2029185 RepID=UPI002ED7EC96